jgi:hypothetical protein
VPAETLEEVLKVAFEARELTKSVDI